MEIIEVNTCIVGTGAAGFNAASRLYNEGQHNILLISENKNSGTSRNTGSDKQTYYKLTLSGDSPDSVYEMASNLFAGEAVDGDIALCEAALSVPSFLRLVELGVPFPVNRYGEYIGYKTDHDPRNRATSVGPYTSKKMTEVLEREVFSRNIPFKNNLQVIKVLAVNDKVCGLLALNLEKVKDDKYVLIKCPNIIYATGGPAGIYSNSVYPIRQSGGSGIAFEAGAQGKNLTEWQYGLASINPRWNVSGTYMQVLPRFISTDENMADEKEFLNDFFSDSGELLTKVFLKGYQWPFDVRKIADGSSIIDVLVYIELCKGRRVFLDFTKDPLGGSIDFSSMSKEAFDYLSKANALVDKPIERLKIMNQPAVDFYHDKGVELETEYLEISLCSQHNNGGLDIDCWWQTNIEGFFACGEVAGSHGVYRPGGSALNAGQVGSTRCSLYIANARKDCMVSDDDFEFCVRQANQFIDLIENGCKSDISNVKKIMDKVTLEMSLFAGPIRNEKAVEELLNKVTTLLKNFSSEVKYNDITKLSKVYKLYDILICQKVYLEAMKNYSETSGMSRGSGLYSCDDGEKPYASLPDIFKYKLDDGSRKDLVQIVSYNNQKCHINWRKVRPLPTNDDFFENTWKQYRENKNIY